MILVSLIAAAAQRAAMVWASRVGLAVAFAATFFLAPVGASADTPANGVSVEAERQAAELRRAHAQRDAAEADLAKTRAELAACTAARNCSRDQRDKAATAKVAPSKLVCGEGTTKRVSRGGAYQCVCTNSPLAKFRPTTSSFEETNDDEDDDPWGRPPPKKPSSEEGASADMVPAYDFNPATNTVTRTCRTSDALLEEIFGAQGKEFDALKAQIKELQQQQQLDRKAVQEFYDKFLRLKNKIARLEEWRASVDRQMPRIAQRSISFGVIGFVEGGSGGPNVGGLFVGGVCAPFRMRPDGHGMVFNPCVGLGHAEYVRGAVVRGQADLSAAFQWGVVEIRPGIYAGGHGPLSESSLFRGRSRPGFDIGPRLAIGFILGDHFVIDVWGRVGAYGRTTVMRLDGEPRLVSVSTNPGAGGLALGARF